MPLAIPHQPLWRQKSLRIGTALSLVTLAGIGVLAFAVSGNIAPSTSTDIQDSQNTPAANQGTSPTIARPERPVTFSNAIEERSVTQLKAFGEWLSANKSLGYIGEVGWPVTESTDTQVWNTVADSWYRESYYHNLWVTAWAAGSYWSNYPLTIYGPTGNNHVLSQTNPQANVIERYPTADGIERGVNLAGMEFGTEKAGFSNSNPGKAGQDYFYEPANSYQYLAEHGVKLVRLPFRWERIQPQLGGQLNQQEVQAITKQLDAAKANNVKVILDLHNYGQYITADSIYKLGDNRLGQDQLVDVWQRLSKAFKAHPALAAYGIMNEPHDLPAGQQATPAKNWETASQAVVDALRSSNDNSLIMVGGYDWSSLARWQTTHPTGWIRDPAHNFRYEAHHYWDKDGSGIYKGTFEDQK